MQYKRTSRPHAFAPRREAPILARRALGRLLPSDTESVFFESDGTPNFGNETLIRSLKHMSDVARSALDHGLVSGVLFEGKMVVLPASALRDLFDALAPIAWGHVQVPDKAVVDAQSEIIYMLQSLGLVPDFAVQPEVEANTGEAPEAWAQRVYPAGTRVRALRPAAIGLGRVVPAGTVGTSEIFHSGRGASVVVNWEAPAGEYSMLRAASAEDVERIKRTFEPLTRRPRRTSKKRTSRKKGRI